MYDSLNVGDENLILDITLDYNWKSFCREMEDDGKSPLVTKTPTKVGDKIGLQHEASDVCQNDGDIFWMLVPTLM